MHPPIPPHGTVHPLGNGLFIAVQSWQMGRKRRLLYGMSNTEPARAGKAAPTSGRGQKPGPAEQRIARGEFSTDFSMLGHFQIME